MGLLATTLLLAGCARTTGGHAVAGPSHTPRLLAGGDLDNILLTPSQLSGIVGAKVQLQADVLSPVAGDPTEGPCAGLDAPGMQLFVGDSYSAFHMLLMADGSATEHDHVVTEAVTVYVDEATAAKTFATAIAGLQGCNGQQVQVAAAWRFAVNDTTADTVHWNKEQTDLPSLWVCYGQGRVRDNAIVQAMSCQGDDGGNANADTISNRMSAAIWDATAG